MRDELLEAWKENDVPVSERLKELESDPEQKKAYEREVKQGEEYRTFFAGEDYDPGIRENFRCMDADELEEIDKQILAGPDAIRTPFDSLNEKCGDMGGRQGYAKGWHTLIVGLTGSGKSLLGSQFMLSAMRDGVNACYVSNEMSRSQLVTRMLAQISSHPISILEPGDRFDPAAREDARTKLLSLEGNVFINHDPVRTHDQLEDVLKFHREVRNVEMFVVDYLQLIDAPDQDGVAGRIRAVSHRVRDMMQRLDAVSVALSQFSRKQQAKEEPSIFNLKGGSTLEQDSDVIVMLDHYHYQTNKHTNESFSYLLIGKNRHGPGGQIPILWDWSSLTARELSRVPTGWVKRENII